MLSLCNQTPLLRTRSRFWTCLQFQTLAISHIADVIIRSFQNFQLFHFSFSLSLCASREVVAEKSTANSIFIINFFWKFYWGKFPFSKSAEFSILFSSNRWSVQKLFYLREKCYLLSYRIRKCNGVSVWI